MKLPQNSEEVRFYKDIYGNIWRESSSKLFPDMKIRVMLKGISAEKISRMLEEEK